MRTAAASCVSALALALGVGCGETPVVTDCSATDGVRPYCEFQNPEDLAALSRRGGNGDWLIVSQMVAAPSEAGGNLLAFYPGDGRREVLFPVADAATGEVSIGDPACPGPPDASAFAPHGIDVTRDGRHLLVVNHGGREAVEWFEIGRGPSLTWAGCVELPEDTLANDVAAGPDGTFVVTKMLEPGALGIVSLLLGRETGHVWQYAPGEALAVVPASEGVTPNGVAWASDGTVWVAEWAARRIVRLSADGQRDEIAVDFMPDNLSWARDGRLIAAGQRADSTAVIGCAEVAEGSCGVGSVVVAIDTDDLAVETLFEEDPAVRVGAASAALEWDGALWVGTFAGDRIVRVDR